MPAFHPLTVEAISKTTRDAVVVTLRADADGNFSFEAGQYLTFRREFGGEELRRSYSICSARASGVLQVGIKRVDGGVFSTWANTELEVGDTLEAMPPMGNFGHSPTTSAPARYLGVAAGSGITPILSILRTTLSSDATARFTLIYANRDSSTIMFRDDIADLKDTYLDRLSVVHVMSRESTDIDLFHGRLDADKCAHLFTQWVDISTVSTAWLCGPHDMITTVTEALKNHGVEPSQIRSELFSGAQPGRARQPATSVNAVVEGITAQVTLNGDTRSFTMDSDTSVLKAALGAKLDVPYACCAGVCSTCKALVIEGDVEMIANHALEDHEVEQGYVLTCQSHVTSERVVIDYDAAGH